jgi:autotransporter-associated beta strand protein
MFTAPGVDPVFGYGAVNIERAVNGPSKLDWGDFVARFDDLTFVWSNRLTGEGALIKDGSGTLVIEATTTNAGGLEVRGGVLRTEFMVADNVTVRSGGTFQAGIWSSFGSDVDNAGRLELLSGEGQNMSTQIHGDYRHRDGATLALPLGRALDVNGTVTIQGGTLEVTGVVRDYTVHDREYLIHAFELDGQFDSLTWAPSLFLEGTLGYGPSQPGAGPAVWLDITRLDVAAAAKAMAGMSPAAISTAERVEQAFDGIDMRQREAGRISDDFIRIAGDFQGIADEREAKSALDSLSGEAHALATTLTFDAIDMGRRALSSRIGVQAPFSAGVWKQSMGQGGETGFASGGHALEGWLVGNDRATPDGHVVGFAFGETRLQDWLGANRERSRDRQTQARFYAGRGNGDGYALAHMGFGRFDRDIQRSLYAGEDARRGVIGSYGGDYASASFEAGRRHRVGDASLALYAGAEHARVRSGEFREWGDSGFALHAEAADMRRTQAFAGLRAGFDLRGASLRAHAEWQQVLSANGFEVQASFTGVDSWSPLPVSGAAESGGLFGLGIDAWLGRAASLSFGLDQRFGPRGNDRMASLRYVLGF